MKHPKSYDSTPETRKRMGKVKLKGGKAECAFPLRQKSKEAIMLPYFFYILH